MRGFTLIELMVYIAIVAGVLLVSLNFNWQIIQGSSKAQAVREVQQNMRLAAEKISQSVLAAEGINSPAGSGSLLSLAMADPNLNPTVIQLAGSVLTISQGAGGPYQLTNNRVEVSSLQFNNISYPDTPGTIQFQITINHVNPGNLNQYEVSLSAQNTISLRR